MASRALPDTQRVRFSFPGTFYHIIIDYPIGHLEKINDNSLTFLHSNSFSIPLVSLPSRALSLPIHRELQTDHHSSSLRFQQTLPTYDQRSFEHWIHCGTDFLTMRTLRTMRTTILLRT